MCTFACASVFHFLTIYVLFSSVNFCVKEHYSNNKVTAGLLIETLCQFFVPFCSVLCQFNRFLLFSFFSLDCYTHNVPFFHSALCFQNSQVQLNRFSMFEIQSIQYHYFHSFFSPSVSASFPLSYFLPPLRISYIYFSEVFLIWHGSRPGLVLSITAALVSAALPSWSCSLLGPELHLEPCF